MTAQETTKRKGRAYPPPADAPDAVDAAGQVFISGTEPDAEPAPEPAPEPESNSDASESINPDAPEELDAAARACRRLGVDPASLFLRVVRSDHAGRSQTLPTFDYRIWSQNEMVRAYGPGAYVVELYARDRRARGCRKRLTFNAAPVVDLVPAAAPAAPAASGPASELGAVLALMREQSAALLKIAERVQAQEAALVRSTGSEATALLEVASRMASMMKPADTGLGLRDVLELVRGQSPVAQLADLLKLSKMVRGMEGGGGGGGGDGDGDGLGGALRAILPALLAAPAPAGAPAQAQAVGGGGGGGAQARPAMPKPEPRPEAKLEPRPEAKLEPRPEAKLEPRPALPKPESVAEVAGRIGPDAAGSLPRWEVDSVAVFDALARGCRLVVKSPENPPDAGSYANVILDLVEDAGALPMLTGATAADFLSFVRTDPRFSGLDAADPRAAWLDSVCVEVADLLKPDAFDGAEPGEGGAA